MSYDQSAVVTAHLEAAAAEVYAALTDAAALEAWYWPSTMNPKAESDPVEDGHFALDAGDIGFAGQYLVLDPPHHIVQSWRWKGDDRDSLVTITLTPTANGTDLTVTHAQLDARTAEDYRAGWESCLSRLPAHLAAEHP
jgi:uncharacterized protein YndB with AHSA1/START domain